MRYLLDTNVCIQYLRYPASKVALRILSASESEISVCSITILELYYGARRSNNPEYETERVARFIAPLPCVNVDLEISVNAAEIQAELARSGAQIGPYDLLIGAAALTKGH